MKKIIHYRRLYAELPHPIVFMPIAVNTLVRLYDDFLRLLFLNAHRESSALARELESDQFRFLRAACLAHLKGSVITHEWGTPQGNFKKNFHNCV